MIRIKSIELNGFKNVGHGVVPFPMQGKATRTQDSRSDVVGIYGPNGSGKTSVIEAIAIFRDLMSGRALADSVYDCLPREADTCSLLLTFALDQTDGIVDGDGIKLQGSAQDADSWQLGYEVSISHDDIAGFSITHERLTAKRDQEGSVQSTLLSIDASRGKTGSHGLSVAPSTSWTALFAKDARRKNAFEAWALVANEQRQSVIFSRRVFEILSEQHDVFKETIRSRSKDAQKAFERLLHPYVLCIPEIALYAAFNMNVVTTSSHVGVLVNMLHIRNSPTFDGSLDRHDYSVDLLKPTTLAKTEMVGFKQTINAINTVLAAFIPGCSLVIHELGIELTDDGSEGIRFEMMSHRGEALIPLRTESEGIKKLVSIANLLAVTYANPSTLLAIDEFDSGIFEYLLGQIVEMFAEYGRGQLLFTAHNLCPLERLSPKSVVFTTANPENRFFTLPNVKKSNNLRDVYLRFVELGGAKEELSAGTNQYEIDAALYEVGSRLCIGADAE